MSLFLLAGVEETLQVIVNVTANEIRAAKLVPIIIKKRKNKTFSTNECIGNKNECTHYWKDTHKDGDYDGLAYVNHYHITTMK